MDAVYTVLGTLVALGGLVTFHELGHFWMARYCGVRVLRFSIGFGKPLLTWYDRQGSEFAIAAIPLGGYVKMLDEREGEVPEQLQAQAFNRKSVGQRFAIVLAGPLANFLLALVFFWVLALLGTQQVRPVIGSVVAESPAAAAGLQPGQEILAVDGESTPGWSAVRMQLIRRLGESGVLVLQVAEAGVTLERHYQLSLNHWLGDVENPEPLTALGIKPWQPILEPVISELVPEGPAQQAGLQRGDRILAFNDQPVKNWSALVELIRAHPKSLVSLTVERQGRMLQLAPFPLGEQGDGIHRHGYLGAGVEGKPWPEEMLRTLNFGPLEAVGEAFRRLQSMTFMTLESLKKMLLGQLSVKNLSGPITIAKVAGASAQSGLKSFLGFMAYLSISLGVLNLLPIPVLDGGHLLFYLMEWMRGRPLSERVQGWSVQIGITLVLAVMLLALLNDLGRL